jgi:hypothetical protein
VDQDAIDHLFDPGQSVHHSNGSGAETATGNPAVDFYDANAHSNGLEAEVAKLVIIPEGGPSEAGNRRRPFPPRE